MRQALRILTWNTWLQFDPTSSPDPNPGTRAPLIAQKLHGSQRDILLLQKVWKGREDLVAGIQVVFPHVSELINDDGFGLHSGLLTVSRFPLQLLGTIDFEDAMGIEGMFARKGAGLWEGTWGGSRFQIASAHLQGDDGPERKSAERAATRRAELRQLREQLLDRHARAGVPQIICGDFSITRGTADHDDALQILGAEDGPITGKVPHTAYGREKGAFPNDIGREFIDEPETLDYILLRSNGAPTVAITRSVRRYTEVWTARGGKTYRNLAYRYALEGRIEFWEESETRPEEVEEAKDPTALRISAGHVL